MLCIIQLFTQVVLAHTSVHTCSRIANSTFLVPLCGPTNASLCMRCRRICSHCFHYAFGFTRSPGFYPETHFSLQGLLVQLPVVKEDSNQEAGLQRLLKEIKRVMRSAAKQNVRLPSEGQAAVHELTKTLVSSAPFILYLPTCLHCQ